MNLPDFPSRREFVQGMLATSAAAAALAQVGCQAAGPREASAGSGDKKESALPPPPKPRESFKNVRVAFIGTGGMGGSHVKDAHELGVTCAALCDVDSNEFKKAKELFPDAPTFSDYREMFDKHAKNIDAVMIGVPDHHHYPATILAMKAGKHVYTQKPLTHTPWEARQLGEAARTYKVATQMGNQGHAGVGWRRVVEWIRSGALGDIKEVHTWTDRPIWPQGVERPEGQDTVPGNLNWDAWLGPAPARPYKNDTYHRFKWRGWWDFGCGALGDMACHTMDGMFWAMNPGHCEYVEPMAMTPMNNETFPKSSVVKWHFGRGAGRPAFDAYWYDGALLPPAPPTMEVDKRTKGTGNLFIGTKRTLLVQGDYGESCLLIPEAERKAYKAAHGDPKQLIQRSPGHIEEWLMACSGDQPIDFPKSNFSYSAPMSETLLLGNIAMRMGRRLDWDGKNMRFTNVPDANKYVTKEYREGWKF